jgi:hypothetical protein
VVCFFHILYEIVGVSDGSGLPLHVGMGGGHAALAGHYPSAMWNCLHIPSRLAFASLQYHGLGVHHPFYQQMISHLVALVAETTDDLSVSGKLLQGVAEDLSREISLPGEFTEAPWARLAPVVTHIWLTHFLCFAAEHQVLIHDPLPKLITPHLSDRCLMDFFYTVTLHVHRTVDASLLATVFQRDFRLGCRQCLGRLPP